MAGYSDDHPDHVSERTLFCFVFGLVGKVLLWACWAMDGRPVRSSSLHCISSRSFIT